MARTPGGRGFIPITQASCLKDQASSWYPLMQSRLGCVLWSLQPKDHQPESGVLSATSFSLCVSVPGFLSPREQGLPSAFRVPKSFIKPGALELGSPWALLAPSQELSTSLPADHQKVRVPHPTWSFHACAYHRPKPCLDFPVPQGIPFSVSPIQSLPASQTCPSASSSPLCVSQLLSRPRLWTSGSLPSTNPQPLRGLTSTVLVAEIGEAPHVGQVYGEADHRQQKVDFLAPGLPGLLVAVAGCQEALDAVALFHHQEFCSFALPLGLLRPRARPAVLRLHLWVHPRQKHGCGWREGSRRYWEHAEALLESKEKMRSLGPSTLPAPPEASRERRDTVVGAR